MNLTLLRGGRCWRDAGRDRQEPGYVCCCLEGCNPFWARWAARLPLEGEDPLELIRPRSAPQDWGTGGC